MNEFIVWDNEKEKFVELTHNAVLTIDNKLIACSRQEIFNYIGKTDIEGNKIYADSSIVEFCFFTDDGDGNMIFNGKHIAYFSFDEVELVYFLEDNSGVGYEFDNTEMKNFKIIGTLQKNKELLDETRKS